MEQQTRHCNVHVTPNPSHIYFKYRQLLAMHICIDSILEHIVWQPSHRAIHMETRVIYIRKPQLKVLKMTLTYETRIGHLLEEPSIGVTMQDQRGILYCSTNGVYWTMFIILIYQCHLYIHTCIHIYYIYIYIHMCVRRVCTYLQACI